jgi:excisionase family DNA binding protein
MITMTSENRLDASLFTQTERDELPRLLKLLDKSERPTLKLNSGDESIALPKEVYKFLVNVVRTMNEGRALICLPDDEEFTTQAAAEFLGVSRQHLVDRLLETGEIPFHSSGTHRRIYFRDLLAYQAKRDRKRRVTLNNLFDKIQDAGLYEDRAPGDATS